MAETFAIEVLLQKVRARFTAEGTAVQNVFGWRAPAQHVEGSRIAWVPGDPNGKLGELLGPRSPGGSPRPLYNLAELYTVYISSSDPTNIEDETLQYKATRHVYNAWLRAVYLAAHGTYKLIDSGTWLAARKERRHGATLRCVIALQTPIIDAPQASAPVDTTGNITIVLDTTGGGTVALESNGQVITHDEEVLTFTPDNT